MLSFGYDRFIISCTLFYVFHYILLIVCIFMYN